MPLQLLAISVAVAVLFAEIAVFIFTQNERKTKAGKKKRFSNVKNTKNK